MIFPVLRLLRVSAALALRRAAAIPSRRDKPRCLATHSCAQCSLGTEEVKSPFAGRRRTTSLAGRRFATITIVAGLEVISIILNRPLASSPGLSRRPPPPYPPPQAGEG